MASNTHTALRLLVTAAAAAAAALVTTAAAQDVTDQGGPEWSYAGDATGPDNWANLDPRYEACGGDRQSPIDLAPTSVTGVSSLSRVVNLLPSRFVVNEDKRNSVHYECDFGRCGNTEWGGIDYTLAQLHFHTQSEHTLNGQPAPMEMHLVHLSPSGKVLVLAVLWAEGAANAAIEQLLAATPNANTTTLTAANWASLTTLESGYCVYEGSATTPDCAQNVVWLVQRQLMTAAAAQIARVRTTFKLVTDFRGNWRPTQPRNGRPVVCFDAESGGCSLPMPSPYGPLFRVPAGNSSA